jgi:hypothetical protein
MEMRLYRFRSDQNPEYTIDILRNKRLFCAHWRELNDPMEGTYSTLKCDTQQDREEAKRAIYGEKVLLRVCSLSKTYKKHTMWAYYANGFRGAAIEFELDDPRLHPIDYASGTRIQTWVAGSNPYTVAQEILTKKHSDWKSEQEIRLLNENDFYQLPEGCISSVILGSRIEPSFKAAICNAAEGIPLRRLMIRSGELWADPQ